MRFIASIDTFRILQTRDSSQYKEGTVANPSLSGTKLQAILKYKDLETLDISHRGTMEGFSSIFNQQERSQL